MDEGGPFVTTTQEVEEQSITKVFSCVDLGVSPDQRVPKMLDANAAYADVA